MLSWLELLRVAPMYEPIPDARLEIIPWAERTAEEQARYESLGR